jgi:ribosome-binding protein aMBF1 (putative translation factor)
MMGEGSMEPRKRKRLRAAGWVVGSAAEFLKLSDVESAIVEMRLRLSDTLRRQRTRHGLSQTALAKQLGSSQSRVAKMEAADPTVSLDLLVRALFAAGATLRQIARAIAA